MKILKSIQTQFSILMFILIISLTLPVLFSGIFFMNRIIYENSEKVLKIELANLINNIEKRYQKLKRFGLEDSEFHLKEVKKISLNELKNYKFNITGRVFVIDITGKPIIFKEKKITPYLLNLLKSSKTHFVEFKLKNNDFIAFFNYYPRWKSFIGIYMDKNEIFKSQYLFKNITILSFIFGLFISLIIISFIRRRIVLPIIQLSTYAKKISEGNLDIKIKGKYKYEFYDLKKSFSLMVKALKDMLNSYKNREKEIQEERDKLFTTLAHIDEGIITIDNRKRIILMNPQAEKILNKKFNDVINKNIEEILKIDFRFNIKQLIKRVYFEHKVIMIDKKIHLLTDKGKFPITLILCPIKTNEIFNGIVIVFRDITDKIKMEQEIIKLEKLQAIQILAGGIAHDFNNILMGITGNVSLLNEYIKESKDIKIEKKLNQILEACNRAKDLAYQLLTFAKGGEPIKKTTSIKNILINTSQFLLRGTNITLEFDIPDDLWYTEIDIGQFNQVIQNIILNARDALKGKGTIKIVCRNLKNYQPVPYESINDWIEINIIDNGPGIPEDIINKIFDPFFTTKEHGSGLGLSICHSIITKHEGKIEVYSEKGKGTTVKILLPVSEKGILEKEEKTEKKSSLIKKLNILIIDDNKDVREVLTEMLELLGHNIVAVDNGFKGIEYYKREKFDLVITDLTIPGSISGDEIAREILKLDKNAKIIVASGYSEDPVMANYEKYGFCEVLKKPIKLEELKEKISKICM